MITTVETVPLKMTVTAFLISDLDVPGTEPLVLLTKIILLIVVYLMLSNTLVEKKMDVNTNLLNV